MIAAVLLPGQIEGDYTSKGRYRGVSFPRGIPGLMRRLIVIERLPHSLHNRISGGLIQKGRRVHSPLAVCGPTGST
jgi:hypothetical protein